MGPAAFDRWLRKSRRTQNALNTAALCIGTGALGYDIGQGEWLFAGIQVALIALLVLGRRRLRRNHEQYDSWEPRHFPGFGTHIWMMWALAGHTLVPMTPEETIPAEDDQTWVSVKGEPRLVCLQHGPDCDAGHGEG